MRVEWGEAGRKARGWLGSGPLAHISRYLSCVPYFVGIRKKQWDGVPPGKRFWEVQVGGMEDEAGWVAWAACPSSSQPSPTRSNSAASCPSTDTWIIIHLFKIVGGMAEWVFWLLLLVDVMWYKNHFIWNCDLTVNTRIYLQATNKCN